MGYQIYTIDGRDCGYGVPALCDHPRCSKKIDRGLAYICGGEPESEYGCGLYFCEDHLYMHIFRGYDEDYDENIISRYVCKRCDTYKPPYKKKPDILEWVAWKLYHESWSEWREENKKEVDRLKEILIS